MILVMEGESKSSAQGSMQSGSFNVVTVPRILFVDDEPTLARLVVKVLARDYDVVTVLSAGDALRCVIGMERFDAVLVDLHLPDMNAEQLLERLEEVRPDLARRVAFVTGGGDSVEEASFLRHHGSPRLGKPFEIDELRAFVAALLADEPVVETRRAPR